MLGEALVLHVLEHLLELRAAPIFGRKPPLRNGEE